jgi:hypothetical protein
MGVSSHLPPVEDDRFDGRYGHGLHVARADEPTHD